MLSNAASVLTAVEMMVVNLYIINKCSFKRYSRKYTYLIMLLSIAVILPLSYYINSLIPGNGSGHGLFVFPSFLFLFPLMYLYESSVPKIVCLACLSWVYTFIVFALSVHIGYLLPEETLEINVFAVQTALYVVTLAKYYGLVKDKFLRILTQLTHEETISLMWMSIFWFWTTFIMNLSFIYEDVRIFKVLSVASIALCAFNFYRQIYLMLDTNRVIQKLEDVAYKDSLTQLRGRVLLNSDAEDLMKRNIHFSLIFIDLDNFKYINDTYGHLRGDDYLAFFADEIKKRVGSNGGFYRIAGDEFVCLYTSNDIVRFMDSVAGMPKSIPGDDDIPFLGFSYGISSFPEDAADLNELIHIADGAMYGMKEGNKARG